MATAQRITSDSARQSLMVALAAAQKACGEDYDRDELVAGSRHEVKISLAAEVDGTPILRGWDCTLDVGHDATRASSVGVKAGELLAYLLSRVNAATRDATLRDLADTYAANGRLPVDEDAVKAADAALAKLRQKVDQPVRGQVRVNVKRIDDADPVVVTPPPASTAPTTISVPVAARQTNTTKAAKPAAKPKAPARKPATKR